MGPGHYQYEIKPKGGRIFEFPKLDRGMEVFKNNSPSPATYNTNEDPEVIKNKH